ncbi:MAG: hypothetical protein JWP00_3029 [Chloroflexi bacterium]|nr:hypothetical protein [Chloroflexota bacterium]
MEHLNLRSRKATINGNPLAMVSLGILVLLMVGLLAACGDNTATTAPATTAAATTAPLGATPAATTAVTTAISATTAAVTSTIAAVTSTIAAPTTAASVLTTAAVTTVVTTSTAATTAAGSGTATGTPAIKLPSDTVVAGTTITITGEGFPGDTWLTIQFGPGETPRENASLALTDASGKFQGQLILNAYGDGSRIVPGKNIIVVATQDGKVKTSASLTIQPAPAPTPTPAS